MKIFRNKKDKKLYVIRLVSPMMYLGSWFQAYPYKWNGKIKKNARIKKRIGNSRTDVVFKDFEVVAESPKVDLRG